MAKKKVKAVAVAGRMLPCVCDPGKRLLRVPLAELEGFQGELKNLPPGPYAKLKASLDQKGFFAPVFIWAGHHLILDGHQRVKVLLQEGWDVDGGVPVVEVEAKDEKDAAEKLLLITSAYGKVDNQGLLDFTLAHGIDLSAFPMVELPNFVMPVDQADKLWQGMPEFAQEEVGVGSLVVHFLTDEDRQEFSRLIGQKVTEATKFLWHPIRAIENLRQYTMEDEAPGGE